MVEEVYFIIVAYKFIYWKHSYMPVLLIFVVITIPKISKSPYYFLLFIHSLESSSRFCLVSIFYVNVTFIVNKQ